MVDIKHDNDTLFVIDIARISSPNPNETVIDHTKGQTLGSATVNFNINTVDAAGFDKLLVQRKGTITQIINNAMNNQGKMGIV